MMNSLNTTQEKRTYCYVMTPSHFEMAPCTCGNHATQWSEFAGHLWCSCCETDFVPAHSGVFDGPIPIRTALLLGLNFDRFNFVTQKVERFDPDLMGYSEVEANAQPGGATRRADIVSD